MVVVLMGVAGAGKTTLGAPLAARLGFEFIDADDHHPPQNVARMSAGTPLEDADREPWLDALNRLLRAGDAERRSVVLACSALKQAYRWRLAEGVADLRWVYLRATRALVAARLAARRHRYMPATLLESQFAALEAPRDALEVDVSQPLEACLARIEAALAGGAPGTAG